MEGPTLQQDTALALGFLTSIITFPTLWAIFTPLVADAYQKVAKNICSLLPDSGVVVEDNGHDVDTSRTILPSLTKKISTTTTTPDAPINTGANTGASISAINGPSSSATPPSSKTTTTTSPRNGAASPSAASSLTQGRSSPASSSTLASGKSSGTHIHNGKKRSSAASARGTNTSPKPAPSA